ncbi:Reverse transcriptase, RNA-dependent DNA polymerase [Penicillium camemberti]|uniref:Reverse transcriptase, RNA-dependent DNA polymerase n=1 Tax=Penicillium camemberti (strain FM 013) TaxID=1429867 RepID=A0A0G4PY38_PENC3|nr:Reverse transcriptase, RNA-dependent DNA polymerase [Penicillium camemberti]
MELPKGFEEPGYVCRLRRSLYGLKQAPQIWYQCVHRVLVAHGFTMAQADISNSHEIDQVQRALETESQLNDLGTPRSFLGIQLDF